MLKGGVGTATMRTVSPTANLILQFFINARESVTVQLVFCVVDVMLTREPFGPYTVNDMVTTGTKRAVTATLPLGVNVHVGLKLNAAQAPPQASSVALLLLTALRISEVPLGTVVVHAPVAVCPSSAQESDRSGVEMVPAPVEFSPGPTVTMLPRGPKARPTAAFPVSVNVQASDKPEQSDPEYPTNPVFDPGWASSETEDPRLSEAVHTNTDCATVLMQSVAPFSETPPVPVPVSAIVMTPICRVKMAPTLLACSTET